MRSLLTTLLLAIAFTPAQIATAQTAKAPTRKPAAAAKPKPASATASAACKCTPPPRAHIRPYIETRVLTDSRMQNGTPEPDQIWRDGVGRTREETTHTLPDGTPYRSVAIWDPVEKVRMSWSIGRPNTPNVVTIYPFPPSEANPTAPPPTPATPQPHRPYVSRRTETLRPQTIAGFYAEGSRSTTVTPAGTQGNDHDLTTTQEVWTSPDIGEQVRTITEGPNFGKITAETTNVQFVAPDPAVFKAPAGYEVKYATPKPPSAPAPACNCTTNTPAPQPPVHVNPYTLKQTITHVQTLADGTTITTVQNTVNARDAEGRTYREAASTQNGDVIHSYSIYDYPTQTRYSWTDGPNYPKVVTVFRPRPVQPQPAVLPTPAPPIINHRYYPSVTETLPPQTIAGVYAEGTCTTRTIPAGYEGNDRDLVTTTEYWRSPDLGLTIRQVIDDPRNGKSTTDTTDIQQSADPSLFQPPAGYTLRENNPQ